MNLNLHQWIPFPDTPEYIPGEHSPFVTITINVATRWLFEDGYAKEAARYFQTAGNSFRTMLKKPPCRCMVNIRTNRECSPQTCKKSFSYLRTGRPRYILYSQRHIKTNPAEN